MLKETEMDKLAKMLTQANIPFVRRPTHWEGEQFVSPNEDNIIIDVICTKYSYGGDRGLLEVMWKPLEEECGDSCRGYLTAEQAFEYFVRASETSNLF